MNTLNYKEFKTALLLIFFLTLFHSLNNYYIISKSRTLVPWDSAFYFDHSLKCLNIVAGKNLNFNSFIETFRFGKPPLFFYISALFLLIHKTLDTVIMVNMLYLAVSLFLIYEITKKLYSHETGLLAVFLFSMFPGMFALSRVYYIETALTTIVLLTYYMFLLNRFDSLKFSLLTGLVTGLGMLTKPQFPVFILPVVLYGFIREIQSKDNKKLINYLLALSLGFVIAAPWYLASSNIKIMLYAYNYTTGTTIWYYIVKLFYAQLMPVYFTLFIISAGYSIYKKSYLLPLSVICILFLHSVINNRYDKNIVPLLPFIAITISSFIVSVNFKKKLCISLVVIYSFFQFVLVCYGGDYTLTRAYHTPFLGNFGLYAVTSNGTVWKGDAKNWHNALSEILDILIKNNTPNFQAEHERKLAVILQNDHLIPELWYQIDSKNINYNILDFFTNIYFKAGESSPEYLFHPSYEELNKYQFIIFDEQSKNDPKFMGLIQYFIKGSDLLGTVPVPDSGQFYAYKRK
jgi:4-amino-4-deoxy-L-arabinose transferase-like glycosyltransferase